MARKAVRKAKNQRLDSDEFEGEESESLIGFCGGGELREWLEGLDE